MASSRSPTSVCYGLLFMILILLLAAMVTLSILVSKGLIQEDLNRQAGGGTAYNCTLLSKDISSQEFNTIWWLTSYSVGLVNQPNYPQSQLVYYNSLTKDGLDLNLYSVNDTINCNCTAEESPRCVIWSPTQRPPALDNLIIGLALTLVGIFFVSVLIMSIFNTFLNREHIQLRLWSSNDGWRGWRGADAVERHERQPIIQA